MWVINLMATGYILNMAVYACLLLWFWYTIATWKFQAERRLRAVASGPVVTKIEQGFDQRIYFNEFPIWRAGIPGPDLTSDDRNSHLSACVKTKNTIFDQTTLSSVWDFIPLGHGSLEISITSWYSIDAFQMHFVHTFHLVVYLIPQIGKW